MGSLSLKEEKERHRKLKKSKDKNGKIRSVTRRRKKNIEIKTRKKTGSERRRMKNAGNKLRLQERKRNSMTHPIIVMTVTMIPVMMMRENSAFLTNQFSTRIILYTSQCMTKLRQGDLVLKQGRKKNISARRRLWQNLPN